MLRETTFFLNWNSNQEFLVQGPVRCGNFVIKTKCIMNVPSRPLSLCQHMLYRRHKEHR